MVINDREIVISNAFFDDLASIEIFISKYNALAARRLTTEIFNFAIDIIATHPLAFPKHQHKKYKTLHLRKAVFKKDYILIYLISDNRLDFLRVYNAKQNSKKIKF